MARAEVTKHKSNMTATDNNPPPITRPEDKESKELHSILHTHVRNSKEEKFDKSLWSVIKRKLLVEDIKPNLGMCFIIFAIPLLIPGITLTAVAFDDETGFSKYSALHIIGMVILGISCFLIILGIGLSIRFRSKIVPENNHHSLSTHDNSLKIENLSNHAESRKNSVHFDTRALDTPRTDGTVSANFMVETGNTPRDYQVNRNQNFGAKIVEKKRVGFSTRSFEENRKVSSSSSQSDDLLSSSSDDASSGSYTLNENLNSNDDLCEFENTDKNDILQKRITTSNNNIYSKTALQLLNNEKIAQSVSMPTFRLTNNYFQENENDFKLNREKQKPILPESSNDLQLKNKLPPLRSEVDKVSSRKRLDGQSNQTNSVSEPFTDVINIQNTKNINKINSNRNKTDLSSAESSESVFISGSDKNCENSKSNGFNKTTTSTSKSDKSVSKLQQDVGVLHKMDISQRHVSSSKECFDEEKQAGCKEIHQENDKSENNITHSVQDLDDSRFEPKPLKKKLSKMSSFDSTQIIS